MDFFENTIPIPNLSPEGNLLKSQGSSPTAARYPFPRKTAEMLYQELAVSRKQASEGKCMEMGQALKEIRTKYGLITNFL